MDLCAAIFGCKEFVKMGQSSFLFFFFAFPSVFHFLLCLALSIILLHNMIEN